VGKSQHLLDDPLRQNVLLQALRAGATIRDAVKLAAVGRRSYYRLIKSKAAFANSARLAIQAGENPDRRQVMMLAEALSAVGSGEDSQAILQRILERVELAEDAGDDELDDDDEPEPRPKMDPKRPIGDLILDAEVVHPPVRRDGDDLIVGGGLPPLNRDNVLAFYWRVMHSRTEDRSLRNTAAKAIYDYMLNPRLAAGMAFAEAEEVVGGGQSPGMREPGLTAATMRQVRHSIIGPEPEEREADDRREVVDAGTG